MADQSPERQAMFEFGRQLGNPDFRKVLAALNRNLRDQDVIVAVDSTTLAHVLDRVFTRTRPPAIVAIRRPNAPLGFVFMRIDSARVPTPDDVDRVLGPTPESSIGMLYDTMAASSSSADVPIGGRYEYLLRSIDTGKVLAAA